MHSPIERPTPVPLLVIVLGPPASGKTTLARQLAPRLGLPLMTKDMIKEVLFDTLGWSDLPWSRTLGRASIALLIQYVATQISAGQSCMIECNFTAALASPEFLKLQQRQPCTTIQILCRASYAVLYERYRRRAAAQARHPGHLDDAGSIITMQPDHVQAQSLPLEIAGHLITVDTTSFAAVDHDRIVAEIAAIVRQ